MKKITILAICFGLCTASLPVTSMAQSRQREITVVAKNRKMSLADALKQIQKLTGYNILFTYDDVKTYTVQGAVTAKNVVEALNKVLDGKPFAYVIDGNYVSIVLRRNSNTASPSSQRKQKLTYSISGYVLDSDQIGLPGATIKTSDGHTVISGSDGSFTLELPEEEKTLLTVSYIGMKTYTRTVTRATRDMTIQLVDDAKLDEVVVNGMFEQRKSSYTGATVTFNREQLKEVGNQNLLKSLKNLDPAFQILDNNLTGSNPNAMPDIQFAWSDIVQHQGRL
jgi:type II secretory pathway component GspD/PulD (secretin)